jgi:heat shock protein HslJ
MRKTLVWLALVFSLAAFLIAGCQNEVPQPATNEPAAENQAASDDQAGPPPAASASVAENVLSADGGEGLTWESLRYRKFILTQVNGVAYAGAAAAPALEFGENFQVSGKICNVFHGLGQLENGRLTVKALVSTRMACLDDALSRLEKVILELLSSGAEVSLDCAGLGLKQGETILRYEPEADN